MNSSVDNYSIASKELDNSSAISTGTNFSLSGSKHGEVNGEEIDPYPLSNLHVTFIH